MFLLIFDFFGYNTLLFYTINQARIGINTKQVFSGVDLVLLWNLPVNNVEQNLFLVNKHFAII